MSAAETTNQAKSVFCNGAKLFIGTLLWSSLLSILPHGNTDNLGITDLKHYGIHIQYSCRHAGAQTLAGICTHLMGGLRAAYGLQLSFGTINTVHQRQPADRQRVGKYPPASPSLTIADQGQHLTDHSLRESESVNTQVPACIITISLLNVHICSILPHLF